MPGVRFLSWRSQRPASGGPNIRRIVITELRSRRLNVLFALVAALGLLQTGCGSTGGDGKHPDYAKALAGAPAALAALHRQANQLLPGGGDAFEERIAALR